MDEPKKETHTNPRSELECCVETLSKDLPKEAAWRAIGTPQEKFSGGEIGPVTEWKLPGESWEVHHSCPSLQEVWSWQGPLEKL